MAIDQHGQQAAIHQAGPTEKSAVGRMPADQVNTVCIPMAFQVQTAWVGTAAAIADALGRSQFLNG
ncbi:hypothetical protein D3C76_1472590 [compost metagenome]